MARLKQTAVANGDIDIKLLLTALTALKKGDFSIRLPLDWNGTAGKIADDAGGVRRDALEQAGVYLRSQPLAERSFSNNES